MNIKSSKLVIVFVGVVLLQALSACSDIIPGLNVREGHGAHEYQIVSSDGGYVATEVEPGRSYEVLPVTPDLLIKLSQSQFGDALDSMPSLLPSNVPPEYRVGPGDVFFVVVWDHPELTAPYTGLTSDLTSQGRLVASDGTAYYPYVGVFKAAGMTAGELRSFIADHLKKVVQNPQVDVRVVAYRAGRIEVTGEVAKPGTLTFDDTPKGVLQAIDSSGGLTPTASRRRAILVRDGVVHVIDLAGLLSGARPVANPELRPGDVLHVPDQSGDQVFVLGAVSKQAPVVIPQDSMSLIEALTQAGGLDATKGKDSGVLIFRPHLGMNSKISAQVFTIDLSHTEGVLLASQFKLQPRDVVYVKSTAFSQYNAVIADLLPTITAIFELYQLTK
ncbi:MAG TPA: polysaccharide biosynthesis/export family protein [Nevskia sp.]|nr:polysaccharide biosynthesis/export family protein [Nevskia sp.]